MNTHKPFTLSASEISFCESILKKHSVTYYNSTKLFPREIQIPVFALYAWVRRADELVDNPKTNPIRALQKFEQIYLEGLKKGRSNDKVADIFIRLTNHYSFDPKWAQAFLASMKLDLETTNYYQTQAELRCYTFGSAEIIGLYMSRIMGAKSKYDKQARKLGEWMQLVNFLRDIKEDYLERNRIYIPLSVLNKYNLPTEELFSPPFYTRLRKLITEYSQELLDQLPLIIQSLEHLPIQGRIAVRTSVELYGWTLKKINQNPDIPLHIQLKPTKPIVFWYIIKVKIISLFWNEPR